MMLRICILLFASSIILLGLSNSMIFSTLLSANNRVSDYANLKTSHIRNRCSGRYIYVHELPARFNDGVLRNCGSLVKWFDMCPSLANSGLGPQVPNSELIFNSKSWYSTEQFILEMIFRERMKNYDCLTLNSSIASAIYVPVYISLEIGRYLWENGTWIDKLGLDLDRWVADRPEWKRMWGRDHFFVAGRTGGEFRRVPERKRDWGSQLMRLPAAKNMTLLTVEGTAWNSDFGVPYPTYFHPASDGEIFLWQDRVRRRRRDKLFAFVGAPRPTIEDSIRGQLIRACQGAGEACLLINCKAVNCSEPDRVMRAFMRTDFCLQPPGDSLTRRSAFDSILAGCIPVFFHPGSAYTQYVWHFPKNHSDYSVFIPEEDVREGRVSVEETLARIPKEEVVRMRGNVIKMIPRVVYADPRSRLETVEDAFDIAVKRVVQRVEGMRKALEEGKEIGFPDKPDWRAKLNQTIEPEKWAPFLVDKS